MAGFLRLSGLECKEPVLKSPHKMATARKIAGSLGWMAYIRLVITRATAKSNQCEPDDGSQQGQLQTLVQDEFHNITASGSNCHPDAHFSCSLAHEIGNYRKQSDTSQNRCQSGKTTQKGKCESPRIQGPVDDGLHGVQHTQPAALDRHPASPAEPLPARNSMCREIGGRSASRERTFACKTRRWTAADHLRLLL